MISLELPWPNKALSPNARPHWAAKAKATKTCKELAWGLTRLATSGRFRGPSASLEWVFHPKTANEVDLDNCIASCKAYQDGISMGIQVDDKKFQCTYRIGEPIKGGLVRVSISPLPSTKEN